MKTKIATLTLLWPFLAGFCEGQTTDPRAGGYIAGKCALSNGAYDRRLRSREETLDRLDRSEKALQVRLLHATQERDGLDREIASTHSRIAADRREIASLGAELERRRERRAVSEAEIAALRAEKVGIEAEFARLYEMASATEVAVREWRDRGSKSDVAEAMRERSHEASVSEGQMRDRIDSMRRRLEEARRSETPR